MTTDTKRKRPHQLARYLCARLDLSGSHHDRALVRFYRRLQRLGMGIFRHFSGPNGIGIGSGYHRLWSHRAYEAKRL